MKQTKRNKLMVLIHWAGMVLGALALAATAYLFTVFILLFGDTL